MQNITIITNLLIIILGCFITATFTHFLHWCFGSPNDFEAKDGRIFSFYGIWLSRKYNLVEERHDRLIEQGKRPGLNWYKILGMCIYCFGAYVAFISLATGFLIGWYHLSAITQNSRIAEGLILALIYPAICNFFLRKIK